MILERERATALRRDAMQNPKDFDPAFLHEQSNEHRSSRGGFAGFPPSSQTPSASGPVDLLNGCPQFLA